MLRDVLQQRYLGEGASQYNKVRASSTRWQKEHKAVRDFLLPHRDRSALDLPVGTGRFIPIYKELHMPFIGVDRSPEMLAEARREARRQGYTNGEFRTGDVMGVSSKKMESDIGICIRFLNWLAAPHAEKAFARIAAACRKEMIVSLTSIDEYKLDDEQRPAIESYLANAHAKPSSPDLPPNGPHSWTSFTRWCDEADFEIVDAVLILEGQNFLKNEIHRLVRR